MRFSKTSKTSEFEVFEKPTSAGFFSKIAREIMRLFINNIHDKIIQSHALVSRA